MAASSASASETPVHFEVVSTHPAPNPCRCTSCRRNRWGYEPLSQTEIREFEAKTLERLLKDCFVKLKNTII